MADSLGKVSGSALVDFLNGLDQSKTESRSEEDFCRNFDWLAVELGRVLVRYAGNDRGAIPTLKVMSSGCLVKLGSLTPFLVYSLSLSTFLCSALLTETQTSVTCVFYLAFRNLTTFTVVKEAHQMVFAQTTLFRKV